MFESFSALVKYRSMIRNLVKRDIRGRYKGSVLGFIWNFLTPLVQILVYVMVFTTVFRPELDHYAIYLMAGMGVWIWFSESLSEGSGTFVVNSDMLKKIYFPRMVLPISVVVSKMVNFFILTVIFMVVIGVLDHGFSPIALLMFPVAVLITFVLILGLILIFSSINVYFRDVQYIVSVLLMAWIWLTPIMYTANMTDDKLINFILTVNPMTRIVELYQDIFYWQTVPDAGVLVITAVMAIVTLFVGYLVFHFLERDFAEVL